MVSVIFRRWIVIFSLGIVACSFAVFGPEGDLAFRPVSSPLVKHATGTERWAVKVEAYCRLRMARVFNSIINYIISLISTWV